MGGAICGWHGICEQRARQSSSSQSAIPRAPGRGFGVREGEHHASRITPRHHLPIFAHLPPFLAMQGGPFIDSRAKGPRARRLWGWKIMVRDGRLGCHAQADSPGRSRPAASTQSNSSLQPRPSSKTSRAQHAPSSPAAQYLLRTATLRTRPTQPPAPVPRPQPHAAPAIDSLGSPYAAIVGRNGSITCAPGVQRAAKRARRLLPPRQLLSITPYRSTHTAARVSGDRRPAAVCDAAPSREPPCSCRAILCA